MSDKTIIGLTGNIGTGKSAIMRIAAEQGVLTIDADKVVHHILNNDGEAQQEIIAAFGDEVKAPDGGINRGRLARHVFGNDEALHKLEGILHPRVRSLVRQQIDNTDYDTIMLEAIKLLEGELAADCNKIWVSDCGKLLQLQRLVIARGMDENEAFSRMVNQSPQEEKVSRADVVIDTRGTMADTRQQVLAALSGEDTADEPVPAAMPAAKAEPTPVATPEPKPEPEPEPEEEAVPKDVEVVVRRARPSDIPSILLLIHRATGGRVKPKRAEILMSLSERGYLIGQQDDEVTTVIGWYTDKGFAAIERFYIHPPEAAKVTGQAVIDEINRTANELMCEAVFAFVNDSTPEAAVKLLHDCEYIDEPPSEWPRVWQQALKEMEPDEADTVLTKKLWNARVA